MSDPQLDAFRAEITEIDRLIFDAVNRRLDVVARLKRPTRTSTVSPSSTRSASGG